MRSSSSRNLAGQQQQCQQGRLQGRPCRAQSNLNGEKFVVMQVMQAFLFATRISFLLYDVLHAIVHKALIYDRIGNWFGGSAAASEKLYTLSLGLIAFFLLATIIFAFIYNYMLVHENLYGISTMGIFLVVVLVYNVVTFGRYTSVMESTVICVASGGEIVGVIYLLALIKHKKEVRYKEKFERQFSGGEEDEEPSKLLPHQRRLEHQMSSNGGGGGGSGKPPPPPSITISFTPGSESEEVMSLSRIDENSLERDGSLQGSDLELSYDQSERESGTPRDDSKSETASAQDREQRQPNGDDEEDDFSRYHRQHRGRHHRDKQSSQQSSNPPPQPQHPPQQLDPASQSAKLHHRSKHKPGRGDSINQPDRESESTNSLNDSPPTNATTTNAKTAKQSTSRRPKTSKQTCRQQSGDHLTVPSGGTGPDDDLDDLEEDEQKVEVNIQANDNFKPQTETPAEVDTSQPETSVPSSHQRHRSKLSSQGSQDNQSQDDQQQQHSPPTNSGQRQSRRHRTQSDRKSVESESAKPPPTIRSSVKTVVQDDYHYGAEIPYRDVVNHPLPTAVNYGVGGYGGYSNSTEVINQSAGYGRATSTSYDPLNHYRSEQVLSQPQHPDYRYESFYQYQPDQFQYRP